MKPLEPDRRLEGQSSRELLRADPRPRELLPPSAAAKEHSESDVCPSSFYLKGLATNSAMCFARTRNSFRAHRGILEFLAAG